MSSVDLRHRAGWLRAVSSRLPSRDVADMLRGYAEEMEVQAETEERHQLKPARWPRA